MYGPGTFTQTGGTHTVNGWLTIAQQGTSTYTMSNEGSKLTVNGQETVGWNGIGTFTQNGGDHTINGNLYLAAAGGSSGTFNLFGGTLTVNADSDPNTSDLVNNHGTFNARNATADFNISFENYGAFINEPTAAVTFTDLLVGPTGYLQGSGAEFIITGNLENQSIQNMYSHSQGTLLTFSGEGPHGINTYTVGDYGASMSGYTNNYALRNIKILGTTVSIIGNALYLEGLAGAAISGDAVTNIIGNGHNVYYFSTLPGNAYLNKKTYSLVNGGQLIPIDPTCECDLNHDGRCDMRDWLLFGQRWGATNCNTVPCACDLNNDGRCDMRDWLKFGEDWGRTNCPIQ